CDFYSRYLSHPEVTFGARFALRSYAASLLSDLTRSQTIAVLRSFSDDEFGDWSGATTFFELSEDEIWDGTAIIDRGTVQQGIAEVLAVATTPQSLLSIAADPTVPATERCTAVGVFGYLGYTCNVAELDDILSQDDLEVPIEAMLAWLRYWMVKEVEESGA